MGYKENLNTDQKRAVFEVAVSESPTEGILCEEADLFIMAVERATGPICRCEIMRVAEHEIWKDKGCPEQDELKRKQDYYGAKMILAGRRVQERIRRYNAGKETDLIPLDNVHDYIESQLLVSNSEFKRRASIG